MSIKHIVGAIILIAFVFLLFNGRALYEGREQASNDTVEQNENTNSDWQVYQGNSNTGHDFTLKYPSNYSINNAAITSVGWESDMFVISNEEANCNILSGIHVFVAARDKMPAAWAAAVNQSTESQGGTEFAFDSIITSEGKPMILNAKAENDALTPKEAHRFFVNNMDSETGVYQPLNESCVATFKEVLSTYEFTEAS